MVSKLLQRLYRQSFAPVGRKFSELTVANSSTKLGENTLTGRILLYFDSSVPEQLKTPKSEEIQLLHHIKAASNYTMQIKSTEQLKNLFLLANDPQCINTTNELLNAFKRLDSECCCRLNTMETKDVLDILRLYARIVPSRLNRFTFYETAIDKLSENLGVLTKNELLQLIFFVGQQKKSRQSQNILRECLKRIDEKFINELTAEELCIICNATFKTTTRISDKMFLNRVKVFINENLYILKDPAVFITLVKTIRQNQCQDDNVLSTISCAVFFNKTLQYYGFAAMCHILALYADYMYYDENILKHFSSRCIDELKNSKLADPRTYLTEQIRDKDLKRFLWSLSRLGYNLDADIIKVVVIPNIIERIQKGELRNDLHSMVDIVLYLWMMNYQALELLSYVLVEKNLKNIYASDFTRRLNILLTAIFFENRPVFRDFNITIKGNPNFNKNEQIRKRPTLKRVFDNLKVILPKTELSKFEFNSQIPYFEIIGITGFKKNIYKAVNVEVLDEFTSLRNTDSSPSGLMQMKLRILNGLEEGLIVVSFLFSVL